MLGIMICHQNVRDEAVRDEASELPIHMMTIVCPRDVAAGPLTCSSRSSTHGYSLLGTWKKPKTEWVASADEWLSMKASVKITYTSRPQQRTDEPPQRTGS